MSTCHRSSARCLAAVLALLLTVSLMPLAAGAHNASHDGPPPGVRGGPPGCPDNLQANAGDEGVLLTWDYHLEPGNRDFLSNEARFFVYRADAASIGEGESRIREADADERFTRIADLDADEVEEFLDEDVEAGASYAYLVTFFDGVESERCPLVQATAVPFFGAPLLGALAMIGALVGYAGWRRHG